MQPSIQLVICGTRKKIIYLCDCLPFLWLRTVVYFPHIFILWLFYFVIFSILQIIGLTIIQNIYIPKYSYIAKIVKQFLLQVFVSIKHKSKSGFWLQYHPYTTQYHSAKTFLFCLIIVIYDYYNLNRCKFWKEIAFLRGNLIRMIPLSIRFLYSDAWNVNTEMQTFSLTFNRYKERVNQT